MVFSCRNPADFEKQKFNISKILNLKAHVLEIDIFCDSASFTQDSFNTYFPNDISNIFLPRLSPYIDEIIGYHKCGF
jgi:hypothetical protein